jgi:hypothetical protein
MSSSILILGVALLTVAFVSHWLLWRIFLPRRQTKAILLIFTAVYAGFSAFALASPGLIELFPYLYLTIFYFAMTLSYMISYTAIEAESPSCLIVRAVKQAGEAGIEKERFQVLITNETFLLNRVQGLLHSGFIEERGGRYVVTAKGLQFLRSFDIPRRILGITRAGG